MIAGRPAATIALYHRRQVQPVDHLDDKPREMPLGKPFIERRRKQKPRRTVKLPEIAHQAHPAGESICAIIPGASIRQVRQAARTAPWWCRCRCRSPAWDRKTKPRV